MKKTIRTIALALTLGCQYGCQNYLEIIPDGTPTIDHVFSNRTNAEKFLNTCYSYLPSFEDPGYTAGFLGGDEFWLIPKGSGQVENRLSLYAWDIGRGSQNNDSPLLNFWDDENGGKGLWKAIRDCNIFLEGIHTPRDLEEYERRQWIAEVTFLKAYYHFYLFQLYGPILITDENLSVNASTDEVRRFRDPVDDVVKYIVKTIDDAMIDLPLTPTIPSLDLGKITKPIAAAVKAQVLLFAASPLMNGNADYLNVRDKRGVSLFPLEVDPNKWTLAQKAAKEAIDIAHQANHQLNTFIDPIQISDTTRVCLSLQEAVTGRWNKEIIWGSTRGTYTLQSLSMPKLSTLNSHVNARSLLAPTLKVVEEFYSSNGVPISEDKGEYWSKAYGDRYGVTTIPDEAGNKYLLEIGQETAKLHLNRELRFYSSLAFDRGTWYSEGMTNDTKDLYRLHFRADEYSGKKRDRRLLHYGLSP